MEKSESIKEIAIALSKFQSEVPNISKDGSNPFFKSKYATLSNILETIKKPLIDNNLSYSQFPSGEHGLTTILMHSSGEWMQDTYKMTPIKNDPQGLGSAITYQRRYALGSILGLNIDEDDDGNKASETSKAKKENEPTELRPTNYTIVQAIAEMETSKNINEVKLTWAKYKIFQGNDGFARMKEVMKEKFNTKTA